jgi:hypothetical protein
MPSRFLGLLAVILAAEKAETSRDIPSRLFLVVSAEMLALLPFPVSLRDYTLVTLARERLRLQQGIFFMSS